MSVMPSLKGPSMSKTKKGTAVNVGVYDWWLETVLLWPLNHEIKTFVSKKEGFPVLQGR